MTSVVISQNKKIVPTLHDSTAAYKNIFVQSREVIIFLKSSVPHRESNQTKALVLVYHLLYAVHSLGPHLSIQTRKKQATNDKGIHTFTHVLSGFFCFAPSQPLSLPLSSLIITFLLHLSDG